MRYRITINAEVESTLNQEELEKQLVVSLYDGEKNTFDGESDTLRVTEYDVSEALKLGE